MDPHLDVERVRRSPTEARRWYNAIASYYDRVIDPFESPARTDGLQLLSPREDESIIDIGCGTGRALSSIARAVGSEGRAVGIDIADEMCALSRARVTRASLTWADVVQGDARTLPFRDSSFDGGFASFVLELFDTHELGPALAEWRRVLKAESDLVVVALSRQRRQRRVRLYEWMHRRFPKHVDCRPIYLEATLRANGYEPVTTRTRSIGGLPVEIVRARPG